MFGLGNDKGNGQNAPSRPAAAEVARIEAGGLAQVIVTAVSPMTFYLFVNDRSIPQVEVDNLEVNIQTPQSERDTPMVRAGLTRYVRSVTGETTTQYVNLFPCTLELIALGRRIAVTAERADSLDNLFVTLGLRADGTGSDLQGLRSLRLVVSNELLDAKLVWEDGAEEDLLPH